MEWVWNRKKIIKILQKETTNKRNTTLMSLLIIRLSRHAIECAGCSTERRKSGRKDFRGEINGSIYGTTRSIHSQSRETPSKFAQGEKPWQGWLKHPLSVISIERDCIETHLYTVLLISIQILYSHVSDCKCFEDRYACAV